MLTAFFYATGIIHHGFGSEKQTVMVNFRKGQNWLLEYTSLVLSFRNVGPCIFNIKFATYSNTALSHSMTGINYAIN
jgi:hypothetical protein